MSKNRVPQTPAVSKKPFYLKGDWRMDPEIKYVEKVPDVGDTGGVLLFGDPKWCDYTFTASVKPEYTTGGRILYRGSGEDRYDQLWLMQHVGRGVTYPQTIAFQKYRWTQEAQTHYDLEKEKYLKTTDWYTMSVRVSGRNVTIDAGNGLITRETTTHQRRGCVGLRVVKGTAQFKDIKVTADDGTVLWNGLPDIK